jgi:hypothetical protein
MLKLWIEILPLNSKGLTKETELYEIMYKFTHYKFCTTAF